MKAAPRMVDSLASTYRCLWVGAIQNSVDYLASWHEALDGGREAYEFLVPVVRPAAADDLTFRHPERCNKRRCAIALRVYVVVAQRGSRNPVNPLQLASWIDYQGLVSFSMYCRNSVEKPNGFSDHHSLTPSEENTCLIPVSSATTMPQSPAPNSACVYIVSHTCR